MRLISIGSQISPDLPLCEKNHGKNKGPRRETGSTWAGCRWPRRWDRKSSAALTARSRQQLMYAGHRKAELRRRPSLWDPCTALMWSPRCIRASSCLLHMYTHPRRPGLRYGYGPAWWELQHNKDSRPSPSSQGRAAMSTVHKMDFIHDINLGIDATEGKAKKLALTSRKNKLHLEH